MSERELLYNLECLQGRSARRKFRKDILEEWGRCAYCGDPVARTLDHVIPKARGGLTTRDNLVACCAACNLDKGHEDLLIWWRRQEFWSAAFETALFQYLRQNQTPRAA
jgi:5-methylcytosine-specific restriction endonuclease McrA